MYKHDSPNGNDAFLQRLRQSLNLSISYETEIGLVYQVIHSCPT